MLGTRHLKRPIMWVQAATDAFEDGAGGRVEQVKPDSSYRHPQPLGRAHEMCVARARKKAATRKAESMRVLALPGGGPRGLQQGRTGSHRPEAHTANQVHSSVAACLYNPAVRSLRSCAS